MPAKVRRSRYKDGEGDLIPTLAGNLLPRSTSGFWKYWSLQSVQKRPLIVMRMCHHAEMRERCSMGSSRLARILGGIGSTLLAPFFRNQLVSS